MIRTERIKKVFAGGFCTEAEPFQIETWEHLHNVRLNVGAHFALNNDLVDTTDGFPDDWSVVLDVLTPYLHDFR